MNLFDAVQLRVTLDIQSLPSIPALDIPIGRGFSRIEYAELPSQAANKFPLLGYDNTDKNLLIVQWDGRSYKGERVQIEHGIKLLKSKGITRDLRPILNGIKAHTLLHRERVM